MKKDNKLVDGGSRTTYVGGGMREICEDKGRCDLVYNTVFSKIFNDPIFAHIELFIRTGREESIYDAIKMFIKDAYDGNACDAYLELAKHYQAGAEKYAERNYERGLPCHTYIDSGLRHYVKWLRGDTDEPHDRAFLWNMVSLLYTLYFKPEFNDLPYNKKENDDEK